MTLCVPTLGQRPAKLARLLESARSGTRPPDDIVVRDNSVDNIGVAASWNAFLRLSDQTVICNDDCILWPDTLACIEGALASGYECVLAGGFHCFALSPSCVAKVGWFDEELSPRWGYFEDNDYSWRMRAASIRGIRIRPVGHTFEASMAAQADPRWVAALARYIAKWGGPPEHETLSP